MDSKVKCTCGWSWNKSDSSKKDMYVCHNCGKDNTMKNGGWLSKFDAPEAQNGIEGTMGGLTDKGFDYNGAWGGTMQMGGSLPGSVGFTYARTQDPAPSKGKYAKKTMASAQNGTSTKQDNTKVVKQDLLKQAIIDPITKKPAVGKRLELLQASKNIKSQGKIKPYDETANYIGKAIKAADVITDLMQLGNFIPNPIGQAIGKAGNFLGAGIDAYQVYDNFQNEDYIGAGINAASLAIPFGLSKKGGYVRDMYNTQPGSLADDIARLGSREGSYRPLTPLLNQGSIPSIRKGINTNRSIFGALVGETYLDTKENGGNITAQNGEEMKYYQEGLDWRPKTISRDGGWLSKFEEGGVIEDDRGQWEHPGEITKINSNQITMQGVDYPVLGISDTGDTQMMQPGQDYTYEGESVTEYPMMKDGGKKSLRSLMNNDDLKSKSDATKVVPQKTMTKEQATKFKAKKDAEELQRRRTAIATSKDAKNKPLSSQNLADESGAIGDKLRMFPNDPDSFIDEYVNPGVMLGNMASGLGKLPLNIQEGNYGQAAMSVATPLAAGALAGIGSKSTGQFANKLFNPASGIIPNPKISIALQNIKTLKKDILNSFDENIVIPIKYRKTIKEVKDLHNSYDQRLQDPEVRKRLKEVLGINPDEIKKPMLTFNGTQGSAHFGIDDISNININPRQIKRLQEEGHLLNPKTVYEHEYGHKLQQDAYRYSDEYQNRLKQYNKDLEDYNKTVDYNTSSNTKNFFKSEYPMKPWVVSSPTFIDNISAGLARSSNLDKKALRDAKYFYEPVQEGWQELERFPHLREMRQNMVEKGYIKNPYDSISKDQISDFMNNNLNDRVSSFVEPSPDNIEKLYNLFQYLPAVAPLAIGASTIQNQKKNGGWLSKYN